MTEPARHVAHGRRMVPLPPSKAPLLFLIGVAVLFLGAAARAFGAPTLVVAWAGLGVLAAGSVAAWLRLTYAGRVILALPVPAWCASFALLGVRVAPIVGEAVACVAIALTLFAFVAVIRPVATEYGVMLKRGNVDPTFVRTLADAGIVEVSLGDLGLLVQGASGEPSTHALAELAPPRVEERSAHTDLVVTDVYGDLVLRLRAKSATERASVTAFARLLEQRIPRRT